MSQSDLERVTDVGDLDPETIVQLHDRNLTVADCVELALYLENPKEVLASARDNV